MASLRAASRRLAISNPAFPSLAPRLCTFAPLRPQPSSPVHYNRRRYRPSPAMAAETLTTRAIVAHEPNLDPLAPTWKMEQLQVDALGDDDLLVKMVSTGICHTDVALSCQPGAPKWVPGHEGAGYVLKAGKNVKKVKEGDPILMSYIGCGDCHQCTTNHPGYCKQFVPVNMGLDVDRFTNNETSTRVKGNFFGHSSFANISIVKEASVLNATHLVKNEDELKMFAPLGCGLQTGAATVVNVAKVDQFSDVMVTGLGAVGLGAIMAAKVQGANSIIAVDRVQSRLDLAKEIGATHTINTSETGLEGLPAEVQKLTAGGASITIDTTGVIPILEANLEATCIGGQCIMLAIYPPDKTMSITPYFILATAKNIRGSLMGDSVPADFIPKMINWYREGKFPFDRLIKHFKAEEFEKALHEMHSGETIKPVLVW